MRTLSNEKLRQMSNSNAVIAFAYEERRQILAAYEVWKFIRQSNELPVVQKVFRENPPAKGG